MPTFVGGGGHRHALRSREDVTLYDGERIPLMSNLSQVLKDWTKAVMVAQPSDTLAFSHEYFTKLSLQGRKKGDSTIQGDAKGGSNLTMSQLAMSAGKVYQSLPIPLQARIEEVFSACDTDGSGAISKAEFFKTIQQIGALHSVEVTQEDADALLSSIDSNSDDQLSWPEFAAAAVGWLADKGLA